MEQQSVQEELSLKPLSKGLGFYEQKPAFYSYPGDRVLFGETKFEEESGWERNAPTPSPRSKGPILPSLPAELLPEEIRKEDWEDPLHYEHLISLLEKPYIPSQPVPSHKAPPPKVSPQQLSPQKAPAPVTSPAPTPAFEKTFYFSIKAYLIDAFSAGLLFLPPFILFLFLTQPNPIEILLALWPKVLIVFLFFTQMYCLLCRLFCFETFGETLTGIRLIPQNRVGDIYAQDTACATDSNSAIDASSAHPLTLFFRFLLSCATGFVLLPVLSFIYKKDIMARLTGLYMVRRET